MKHTLVGYQPHSFHLAPVLPKAFDRGSSLPSSSFLRVPNNERYVRQSLRGLTSSISPRDQHAFTTPHRGAGGKIPRSTQTVLRRRLSGSWGRRYEPPHRNRKMLDRKFKLPDTTLVVGLTRPHVVTGVCPKISPRFQMGCSRCFTPLGADPAMEETLRRL